MVKVTRPKGYQSHGWKDETEGVRAWIPERWDRDGSFPAHYGVIQQATGRTYKDYPTGTYFIKMLRYITGPSGGLTGRGTFEVIKTRRHRPRGHHQRGRHGPVEESQVAVVEGTQAEARYFADQDAAKEDVGESDEQAMAQLRRWGFKLKNPRGRSSTGYVAAKIRANTARKKRR